MKCKRLSELVLAGTLGLGPVGCDDGIAETHVIAEYEGQPAIYFFSDTNKNGSYDHVKICGFVNHHGAKDHLCQLEIAELNDEVLVSRIYKQLESKITEKVFQAGSTQ